MVPPSPALTPHQKAVATRLRKKEMKRERVLKSQEAKIRKKLEKEEFARRQALLLAEARKRKTEKRLKKLERPVATSSIPLTSTASTSVPSTSALPQKAVHLNQNAKIYHVPAPVPSVPTRTPVSKPSRPTPASSSQPRPTPKPIFSTPGHVPAQSIPTRTPVSKRSGPNPPPAPQQLPKPLLPTPGHIPVASIAVPTTAPSQSILYATPVANPVLPPSTSDPSSSMYVAREPSNNTTYYISTVNLAAENKKLTDELTSYKLKHYNLIKAHNELKKEHDKCHRPLVRARHNTLSHYSRQSAGKRIMERLKEMCPIYEEDDWCEALIKLFPKLRTYEPLPVVAEKLKKKRARKGVPVEESKGDTDPVIVLEASGDAGLAENTGANADSNDGAVQVVQDLIREHYPDDEIWILD